MAKLELTDATKGPVRRTLTYVAFAAAIVAIATTLGMLVIAFGVLPSGWLGWCFGAWVCSLAVMYGITRYLRSEPPSPVE